MYAKFLVVIVAIAIVADPINASPFRIKRQGWFWDEVGTARPPVVVTTPNGPTTLSPTITNCITRCVTTNEYNPVCGTNRMTYGNPNKLKCAASCGVRPLAFNYYGPCQ